MTGHTAPVSGVDRGHSPARQRRGYPLRPHRPMQRNLPLTAEDKAGSPA